jgi:hypothetical protein
MGISSVRTLGKTETVTSKAVLVIVVGKSHASPAGKLLTSVHLIRKAMKPYQGLSFPSLLFPSPNYMLVQELIEQSQHRVMVHIQKFMFTVISIKADD